MKAEVVLACSNILGESATWSVREQALYWVDIRQPALHRLHPATNTHDQWPMPDLCGAVILAEDGVVVALRNRLARFDPQLNVLTPLLEIESAALDNRLNEAKCDRSGRMWIGSMRDFAAAVTGSLYVVDPDMTVRRVLEGIHVPNSLGWSPDNRSMYFADSGQGTIQRYTFDLSNGSIREPSILVGCEDSGRPDGCTVDEKGFMWSTRYGAGRVVCLSPDGGIVASVELDASQPTSCALGGRDLRTLYITTAKQKLSPVQIASQSGAGHLYAVAVNTPGLPDTEFGPRI